MLVRVFRSIFNQLSKTVMLCVVFFILFMGLCTAFIMQNSAANMKKEISEIAKPTMAIKTSVDVLDWDEYFSPFKKDGYSKVNSNFKSTVTNYYDNLNKLADDNNVAYYDINMLISSRIPLIPYSEDDGLLIQGSSDENESLLNYSLFLNNNYQFFGHLASTRNVVPSFKYYGYDGELIAGRYFTESEIENGENKIIIYGDSKYFDGINTRSLNVGDILTYTLFKQASNTPIISNGSIIGYEGSMEKEILATYEFEIIGIVENNSYFEEELFKINLIPEKTFIKIVEDCYKYVGDELSFGAISFIPTKYTLNSYDDIDKFVDDINDLSQLDLTYDYETNADEYISLFGEIEGINENFKILFIFLFSASLLILFLIIMFEIDNRKKEISLLTSLGQSKISVCMQFVLEYLFIIIISFILAFICSLIITAYISNNVISIDNSLYQYKVLISGLQIIVLSLLNVLSLIIVSAISILKISKLNIRETMLDD